MNRVIWLAPNEAKCIASACKQPRPCARRDIAAEKGRPLADFSQPIGYVADCCAPRWAKHVPYAQAVKPVDKPVVRDWIGNA